MDVLVTRIYDTLRFKHYLHIKLTLPNKSILIDNIINNINSGKSIVINDLPECDVKYLQRRESYYDDPICDLKILNSDMRNRPSIPPYLDNERKSCVDVSPQPGDEPKQDTLELFHVKFTKVIHYDEMLNERQIQGLLKDKHVKSINVEK